jgi:hypothetical protein
MSGGGICCRRGANGMTAVERESEDALERQVERQGFLLAALFLFAYGIVNATTLLIDAERRATSVPAVQPFIEELSSVAIMVALFPLVAAFARRVPISVEGWPRALAFHAAASIAFSALHVAGMVLLRKLLFPLLLGQPYTFFEQPLRDAIYEYRKDAVTYATFVLVLHLLRQIAEHRREIAAARADARRSGRITLKCGGRTIWIPAESFDWAEAAGNYVEVKAAGRSHLARIGLSALEEQLRDAGLDVTRIHRSFLVNRDKVVQIEPTGDGDFRAKMADGTMLRGSRRYRENLTG